MTWTGAARTIASDLARLVVPVECPGCGAVDLRLCGDCAAAWWESPMRVESGAPRLDIEGRPALPVWAITELDDEVEAVVRAWKDGARRDLDRWMEGAMRLAASRVAGDLAGVTSAPSDATRVLTVVPAPARSASTRRRGVDLPRLLARGVVAGLRNEGVDARCAQALRIGGAESRGRSARARWQGKRASVRVLREVHGPVVMVDDVVTTGATLAACVSALEDTGASVIGALAAAAAAGARTSTQLRLGWDSDDVHVDTFEARGR